MKIIDIYLAHRDSIKFIEQQILLIKKFFKCNEGSIINIFCYVDGENEQVKYLVRDLCNNYNVTTIEIPNVIDGYNRSYIGAGESFGLAFTYVYKNYILKNNHISVCIENDVFPFKDINIEEYVCGFEICGEVRFNAAQLPDRNIMFWLGFIIFNGELMKDRDMFSGLCKPIVNIESGTTHWIDCGGQSYYWLKKIQRNIRQMVTNGNESYNGFTSMECTPHNITSDIQHLPKIFHENYKPDFRVLVYDNCLIHLERMGKENDNSKELWWKSCFNKIFGVEDIYIPIGFQCTTAEILKKLNKRLFSFPFDWIISNPESIVKLFEIFLDKNCIIEHFVREYFFKFDRLLNTIKQEEFFYQDNSNIFYNSNYELIFPHIQCNDVYFLQFVKRFERLKNYILHSNNKLKFVFVNRIINNNNTNANDNKMKFSINNINKNLNIIENLNNLIKVLLYYIPIDRFDIIAINAVEKLNPKLELMSNFFYYELIPNNNSELTDEEILKITI